MIQEIAASDQRRLEEMNKAAEVVREAKEALGAEKAALEEIKAELDVAQAELEENRADADALLQELVAQGMEYEELLEQAEAENMAMMQQINELNSAYDAAKDREYREWLAQQPPPIKDNVSDKPIMGGENNNSSEVDGATWLVPINYTRFTSPYGMRIHPITGKETFHHGVDLAAPEGTPIYASRGGQVTTATYGSSGGYYVIINHMDGYTSNYLHMTHYIVAPGDYVAAGQVIGYCGSTGASTGPHLHFAIYKNGSSVNPANYIPI
jgi:murein DD-endopeptidase MepM/ murein hydrolase activator NlpD